MAYRRIQQDRIDRGLCKNCGEPRSGTAKVYCRDCIQKAKPSIEIRRKKLRKEGLCEDCGNETYKNRIHCETCLAKQRAYRINWKKQLPYGFCTRCGKNECLPQLINAKLHMILCQLCYLKRAASVQLGSSKHYSILLNKLDQQRWLCIYSGDEIILGVNDSMDHIYPKSRYPEKALEPSNIQWTTRVANRIKDNLTHEEFVDVIRRMNKRLTQD